MEDDNHFCGGERDGLFSGKVEEGSFSFGEEVARVFHDMATRSIPYYRDIQKCISYYALEALHNAEKKRASVLDLGCSIGYTIASLSYHARRAGKDQKSIEAYLVDKSQHMLDICRKNIAVCEHYWNSVHYLQCDANKEEEIAELLRRFVGGERTLQVVICNFVLQFLHKSRREALLRTLWDTLSSKGVLVIGEKTRASSDGAKNLWRKMHQEWKKDHHYSEEQIRGKERALEGVLVAFQQEEIEDIIRKLKNAKSERFFSWGPFACYAIHKR